MDTLRLSQQQIKEFISFVFPDKSIGNRWRCSTEKARKLLQTYIRTTRFDNKLLQAANNIVMQPYLRDRLKSDLCFLLFVCNSVRQQLENEPSDYDCKIINEEGNSIRAFVYNDELFSVTLFHDRTLFKTEKTIKK